jgi:hypothetical protein
MSRAAPCARRCCVAYPPAIAELETSRRSRLIDLSTQVSCEAAVAVHHCEHRSATYFPLPSRRTVVSQSSQYIPHNLFLCSSGAIGLSRTLSVPLVHRVPGPLAAVLNVPDLGQTSTGNAEELYECVLVCWLSRFGRFLGSGGRAYGKLQGLVSIGSSRSQSARCRIIP